MVAVFIFTARKTINAKPLHFLRKLASYRITHFYGNISTNESTVLLEASVAGAGISLQPLYAAAPLLRAGRLVQLLPQYRAEALGIHAL